MSQKQAAQSSHPVESESPAPMVQCPIGQNSWIVMNYGKVFPVRTGTPGAWQVTEITPETRPGNVTVFRLSLRQVQQERTLVIDVERVIVR